MVLDCPRCDFRVAVSPVEVTSDVGGCASCGEVFRVAATQARQESQAIAKVPPQGAWLTTRPDGFEVGARARSAGALWIVPVMMMWSLAAAGVVYGLLDGDVHFHILLSLLGLPFAMFSVVGWSSALMMLLGKYTLTVRGDEAELFIGVGSVGHRHRFAWSAIKSVGDEAATSSPHVSLDGRARSCFGRELPEPRRRFVLHALRSKLATEAATSPTPYR